MKIKDVLDADMRIEENIQALNDALLKLPFFKNKYEDGEDISIDVMEHFMQLFAKKYDVRIAYIMPNFHGIKDHGRYHSFSIKHHNDWAKSIYALTFREGFAKTLLFSYAYTRKLKPEQISKASKDVKK